MSHNKLPDPTKETDLYHASVKKERRVSWCWVLIVGTSILDNELSLFYPFLTIRRVHVTCVYNVMCVHIVACACTK